MALTAETSSQFVAEHYLCKKPSLQPVDGGDAHPRRPREYSSFCSSAHGWERLGHTFLLLPVPYRIYSFHRHTLLCSLWQRKDRGLQMINVHGSTTCPWQHYMAALQVPMAALQVLQSPGWIALLISFSSYSKLTPLLPIQAKRVLDLCGTSPATQAALDPTHCSGCHRRLPIHPEELFSSNTIETSPASQTPTKDSPMHPRSRPITTSATLHVLNILLACYTRVAKILFPPTRSSNFPHSWDINDN